MVHFPASWQPWINEGKRMELGSQIKRHRTERGLSQDDLAAKIYVSRQTVSSWENDKTYPDVESLLLLSVLFDVTVDELIKGDVEAMEKTIANDTAKLKIWTGAFLASSAAAVLAQVKPMQEQAAAARRLHSLNRAAALSRPVLWNAGCSLPVPVPGWPAVSRQCFPG